MIHRFVVVIASLSLVVLAARAQPQADRGREGAQVGDSHQRFPGDARGRTPPGAFVILDTGRSYEGLSTSTGLSDPDSCSAIDLDFEEPPEVIHYGECDEEPLILLSLGSRPTAGCKAAVSQCPGGTTWTTNELPSLNLYQLCTLPDVEAYFEVDDGLDVVGCTATPSGDVEVYLGVGYVASGGTAPDLFLGVVDSAACQTLLAEWRAPGSQGQGVGTGCTWPTPLSLNVGDKAVVQATIAGLTELGSDRPSWYPDWPRGMFREGETETWALQVVEVGADVEVRLSPLAGGGPTRVLPCAATLPPMPPTCPDDPTADP